MSVATKTSTKLTGPHDAPRVPYELPDGDIQGPLTPEEPHDDVATDPYDNVACTD